MFRILLPALGLASMLMTSLVSAQTPHAVLLTSDFVLEGKLRTVQASARASGIRLSYFYAGHANPADAASALEGADLVILDAPRGNDMAAIQQSFGELLESHPGALLEVIGGTVRPQNLQPGHAQALGSYYSHGTQVNFEAMFRYWAVNVAGIASGPVLPPVEFPEQGIYHPDLPEIVAESPERYLQWRREAGLHPGSDLDNGQDEGMIGGIGVLMSKSQFTGDQTQLLNDIIARMEARGAVPWVFYFDSNDPLGITHMVHSGGETHVDLLINMTHLQGLVERPRELDTLGLPLLQGVVYREGNVADWRADTAGIPMRSVPVFLAMPEQMGAQDAVVIAAIENGEPVVIDEQLNLLLDRAMRLISLRRKAAQEKKIALMYWSYPPGERGVSASNLNVPRSLALLLPQLAAAGYQVESASAETLETRLPQLLDPWQGQVTLPQWTTEHPHDWVPVALKEYRRWFSQLPDTVRERITARWGEPEQDAMVLGSGEDAVIVIPRIEFGQLVMLPQPARTPGSNSLASYHDGDLPPSHAYLAAYWYLRENFGADALIHFGTHGNQEFLPGKERGLSVDDDAWLALGDLPVIYPYITDNIGEALQARRRGQAVTISHQTPPFAPAGLHGELLEVHDLLHEWQLLDEGPVRARTEDAIVASISEGSLYRDLGWEPLDIEADFPAFQHDLHLYLHELAVDAQPLGLHVFGSYPEPGHRVSTLMQMLGEDLYAALNLEDPSELFVDDYTQLAGSEPYRFVTRFVLDDEDPQLLTDPTLRELALQTEQWNQAMLGNNEVRHLLAALKGRYIPTTSGGDPIRNADILPTGRNIFGFDPSRLPTERAWQVGRELADELIAAHLEKHQAYPESLAISLWSSEAMRQQGVMEAQLLHLLGLEPRWDRGGRLEQLVIVPTETLGRPRVDVVASITGVYRDQFPHFINHLAQAMTELAALDEAANPVSRHVRLLTEKLISTGTDPVRARQLAAIRVFSSDSGNYGTGVPDGVLDTEGWDHDEELAQAYLERMQYGYGAGDGMWAVSLEGINLYAENLGRVQGAVLGRSSNLHGLLSTDHPFEYLGGLAMAVRSLSGTTPDLYISNLRSSGGEGNVSAARFLAGELRSRYQHPGWISAMQDEGYAGTLELLNVVNNFFGWQVTDPSMVRNDQWQAFHAVYLQDSLDLGLQAWFEEHNENAMQRIVERMLEAVRREYWQADDDIVQDLVERHRELAGINGASGKLGDYINTLAAGFGMDMGGTSSTQTVSGQRLTQVDSESAAAVPDLRPWLATLALCLMLGAGALRQWWSARYSPGRL